MELLHRRAGRLTAQNGAGHDTCYAACGVTFEYCEKAFKKCMAGKPVRRTFSSGAPDARRC